MKHRLITYFALLLMRAVSGNRRVCAYAAGMTDSGCLIRAACGGATSNAPAPDAASARASTEVWLTHTIRNVRKWLNCLVFRG